MYTFNTIIQDVDVAIYNLPELAGKTPGSDYDINPRGFTVSWTLELDVREWGVKDLVWVITDIKGTFEIAHFDANGDEVDTQEVTFDFAPFRTDVAVEFEVGDHHSLAPEGLSIDYKTRKVEVT
jgi:hypothetical protein